MDGLLYTIDRLNSSVVRGWDPATLTQASQVMVANLLLRYAAPDAGQAEVLRRFARQVVKNVRGAEVGEMRAVGEIAV